MEILRDKFTDLVGEVTRQRPAIGLTLFPIWISPSGGFDVDCDAVWQLCKSFEEGAAACLEVVLGDCDLLDMLNHRLDAAILRYRVLKNHDQAFESVRRGCGVVEVYVAEVAGLEEVVADTRYFES